MTEHGFSGRLFGPGLPGAGSPATGHWDIRGELHVTVAGGDNSEFHAASPAIANGGFNAAGLRISWQQDDGAYVFMVETDVDLKVCTSTAPPGLARHLSAAARARTGLERRFRFGGALLALLLALPFLGIVALLHNSDTVAGWVVDRIPQEQEARLGELVLAQTRLQMKIIDRGPAVDAVSAIGSRLTAGSVHRYRWFIADSPEVNAFAAPGGVVVVFSGLILAADSAEELAGVLAHEIAHAELRHSLRGMVKSLGLRALVSLLAGDVSGSIFADAATRLMELRFSREAEQEADRNGLQRLVAARIDPQGMIRFYEKLAEKKQPAPPPMLSTHPATGERLAWLRREAAGLKESREKLRVDLEPVKKELTAPRS